jgi:hypothetical protein
MPRPPALPVALAAAFGILFVAQQRLHANVEQEAQAIRFLPDSTPADAAWYKGNTHTHTTNSDGDTPPEAVAQWYKSHGYRWLVLSDHNVFTDPKTLSRLVDSSFLLVAGEEVTTSFKKAAVHVNALDISRVIPPPRDSTLLGTVQRAVDAIRAERAVPHINHPNFLWSIDTTTLLKLERDRLIEIFNGHPTVHNEGGGESLGMEDAWDLLLTRGKRMYGIAVDDAHHFHGEFAADRANPGRGWVVVRVPTLTPHAVASALDAGQFYASTGPVLAEVALSTRALSLRITPQGDFKYTTYFIGRGGRILKTDRTLTPSYTLRGEETYVRAKVVDSAGRPAWVQPFFTTRFVEQRPR